MLNKALHHLSCCSLALKKLTGTVAVLFFVGLPSSTLADNKKIEAGEIIIESTFTFATPPGAMTAGGYLTITNNGTEDETLTGGTASFAEATQVHEMKMNDGVMKMRHLEHGLKIPAGESVFLQPGGFHIMFMQLTRQLKEGEVVAGSLVFANTGEVPVEFSVMNRSTHMLNNQQHENTNHQSDMKHDADHSKPMKNDN